MNYITGRVGLLDDSQFGFNVIYPSTLPEKK